MNFIRFSFGFPFLNQFDDISACAKVFTWWNWNDTEERRDAIRVGHDDNDDFRCWPQRQEEKKIGMDDGQFLSQVSALMPDSSIQV